MVNNQSELPKAAKDFSLHLVLCSKKENIIHLLNKRPFHQSVLVGFEHTDVGFEFCLCSRIHLPKSSKSAFFFHSPLGFELNYLLQNI